KAPSRAHLDRLIQVGRAVLIDQRRKPGDAPESSINWPLDVVVDARGNVTGAVLPIIPRDLFHEVAGVGIRTLDHLVMARSDPPSAKFRVALLLRMAEILSFVNTSGLVHGDVNAKNLAWTVTPRPVMYLIDCDGMVPQRPTPTTGVA